MFQGHDIEYYKAHTFKSEDDTFTFECAGCGSCCRKREEPIIMTGVDIYYIAKEQNMTAADALTSFTRGYIGDTSKLPVAVLKERLDGSCVLLRNGRCTVHKNKPAVCAIYPLGRMLVYDQSGSPVSGEAGERHYNYFCQPYTDCPGSKTSHTYTLREWLDNFGLREKEPESIVWADITTMLSQYMQGLPEKKQKATSRINACLVAMYIGYKTAEPLLPQLEAMRESILEI